jgi:hypothetical protein
VDHGFDAGEGRERRDEDFVAGLQALGDVQQVDGGGPGTGEDDVFNADVGGQFGLEGLALGAQDVGSFPP